MRFWIDNNKKFRLKKIEEMIIIIDKTIKIKRMRLIKMSKKNNKMWILFKQQIKINNQKLKISCQNF